MFKILLKYLVGAAIAITATATAHAQTVDDIIKKGTLVVAIDTTTPPYAMLGTDMQPQGFDIDLAGLIAKSLGVKLEFVTVNSPGRIPALLTNRVDVVVSIFSITAERAQQVWFTDPYAGQCSAVVGPKNKEAHSLKDVEGLKVAVTRGTAEDGIITQYSKDHSDSITVLRFDDYPSTMSAMLSGQVDLMGGRRLWRYLSPQGRQRRCIRNEVRAALLPFRRRHPARQCRSSALDEHVSSTR